MRQPVPSLPQPRDAPPRKQVVSGCHREPGVWQGPASPVLASTALARDADRQQVSWGRRRIRLGSWEAKAWGRAAPPSLFRGRHCRPMAPLGT